jgi:hypothetical protein
VHRGDRYDSLSEHNKRSNIREHSRVSIGYCCIISCFISCSIHVRRMGKPLGFTPLINYPNLGIVPVGLSIGWGVGDHSFESNSHLKFIGLEMNLIRNFHNYLSQIHLIIILFRYKHHFLLNFQQTYACPKNRKKSSYTLANVGLKCPVWRRSPDQTAAPERKRGWNCSNHFTFASV